MRRIPIETIEKYWRKTNTQSDEGVIFEKLKELYDRQPLLMMYLTAADKNALNEDERQLLYYLGSFVVHVLLKESPPIAEVTEEQWEKERDTNLKMLKFVGSEDTAENFHQSMGEVLEASGQPDLLCFVQDLLMNDLQCRKIIRKENVFRVFAHLKIVADCLRI